RHFACTCSGTVLASPASMARSKPAPALNSANAASTARPKLTPSTFTSAAANAASMALVMRSRFSSSTLGGVLVIVRGPYLPPFLTVFPIWHYFTSHFCLKGKRTLHRICRHACSAASTLRYSVPSLSVCWGGSAFVFESFRPLWG